MKTSNKLLTGAIILSMFIFTTFLVVGKSYLKPDEVRAGVGEIIIEKRAVSPFDKISCSNGLVVEIVKSDEYYVQVETYENIQDIIVTKIEDDQIEIKTQNKARFTPANSAKIEVGCPEITKIKVADSVELAFDDDVVGDSLSIRANSASEVDGNATLAYIYIDVSSAANIDIEGAADNAIIECTSAGTVGGGNFKVMEVNAIVTSGASVEMAVSEKLVVNASSGGDFKYSGEPRTSVNASTGGNVSQF